VLIPTTPGVLSALGMLVADTLKDYVRTVMVAAEEASEVIASVLSELEQQGRRDLDVEGIPLEKMVIERLLDLRYVGQSYELIVPFEDDITTAVESFHALHEQRFGYSDPNERVQVVSVRLKARGLVDRPELERQEATPDGDIIPIATRSVIFAGANGPVAYDTSTYERASLRPGGVLMGPAIITQYDTTTVVPPEWRVQVDPVRNLIIELAEEHE
jgi:N-methylhydantoinase A